MAPERALARASAFTVEGCRAARYDAVEKGKNSLSQAHGRAGRQAGQGRAGQGRKGWKSMGQQLSRRFVADVPDMRRRDACV